MARALAQTVVLAVVIACATPAMAQTQRTYIDVDHAAAAAIQNAPPYSRAQHGGTWHCCSKKGALIGAAIGAGLTVLIVRLAVECRECGGTYLAAAAMGGASGAGIGALAAPSARGPAIFPIARIRF